MALLAEINRDRRKRSRPFTPRDFHPFAGKEKVIQADFSILKAVFVKGNKEARCQAPGTPGPAGPM